MAPQTKYYPAILKDNGEVEIDGRRFRFRQGSWVEYDGPSAEKMGWTGEGQRSKLFGRTEEQEPGKQA